MVGEVREYDELAIYLIKVFNNKLCRQKPPNSRNWDGLKTGKLKTYAICKTKKKAKSPEAAAGPAAAGPAKKKLIKKKRTVKMPEELAAAGYEIPKLDIITPDVYELPNRKNFVNYIDDTFKTYKLIFIL